ncbi:cupin domain-containing protein [Montanilutibacter psychrotolerans]|uniref:ChrR-like cupin domain-containing protein n=1 Tax=Montanilutibacter psychrotolerans TaxID=1327343 RepID=A0A3M8SMT6_9GAMM|nr:cupin domain-containing protein [Lysobacter psychrotolerans]RNF82641.1 hypothetical protein EER27_14170 [Lysobacter psychrotolerans]
MDTPNPLSILPQVNALQVDQIEAVEVGPGCTRRTLPGNPGVRAWLVEMAPGSQWPHADHHDTGQMFYVLSGEVIEDDGALHGPGTWVWFAPDTRHRPRSETGVRLLGMNVAQAGFIASGGSPDALLHSYHPTQG